jgi:uncharacterized protein (TIGR02594 family)
MSEALFRSKAPFIMETLMTELSISSLDAAAIAGNLGHETDGFRLMQEAKPVVAGSRGGYGWAQWTGSRRVAFETWTDEQGLSVDDDEANLGFLIHELQTSEKGAITKTRAAKTLDDKVIAFELAFERAGVKHYDRRQKWARIALEYAPDEGRDIPATAPVALDGPPWLARMTAILGLYEHPGADDNAVILDMAKVCGKKIYTTYVHDSIAWCALAINYVLVAEGFKGNDSLWALDFRKYGTSLSGPAVGAIATKTRNGGGHVFLVVGRTADGKIVGRGGNQSDMVCDDTFDPNVLKYNWPSVYVTPEKVGMSTLPIVKPAPKTRKEIRLLPVGKTPEVRPQPDPKPTPAPAPTPSKPAPAPAPTAKRRLLVVILQWLFNTIFKRR